MSEKLRGGGGAGAVGAEKLGLKRRLGCLVFGPIRRAKSALLSCHSPADLPGILLHDEQLLKPAADTHPADTHPAANQPTAERPQQPADAQLLYVCAAFCEGFLWANRAQDNFKPALCRQKKFILFWALISALFCALYLHFEGVFLCLFALFSLIFCVLCLLNLKFLKLQIAALKQILNDPGR